MTSRHALSPEAAAELDAALNYYLANGGPAVAKKVAGDFRRAFRLLARNPEIGHLREDLTRLPVRFWSVYSYLVVYSPDTKPLSIIRVLHGSRDVASALRT